VRHALVVLPVTSLILATGCGFVRSHTGSSANAEGSGSAPVRISAAPAAGGRTGRLGTPLPVSGVELGTAALTVLSVKTTKSMVNGGLTMTPTTGTYVILRVRIKQRSGRMDYDDTFFKLRSPKGKLVDKFTYASITPVGAHDIKSGTIIRAGQAKSGTVVIDSKLLRGASVVFTGKGKTPLATWRF
jgi:uncharacterized protein YceK